MFLPRMTPPGSVRIRSTPAISGCAARNRSASSGEAPILEWGARPLGFMAGSILLQFVDAGAERGDQLLDVGFGGRRAAERHVVEGRDHHTAIEEIEMDR